MIFFMFISAKLLYLNKNMTNEVFQWVLLYLNRNTTYEVFLCFIVSEQELDMKCSSGLNCIWTRTQLMKCSSGFYCIWTRTRLMKCSSAFYCVWTRTWLRKCSSGFYLLLTAELDINCLHVVGNPAVKFSLQKCVKGISQQYQNNITKHSAHCNSFTCHNISVRFTPKI